MNPTEKREISHETLRAVKLAQGLHPTTIGLRFTSPQAWLQRVAEPPVRH